MSVSTSRRDWLESFNPVNLHKHARQRQLSVSQFNVTISKLAKYSSKTTTTLNNRRLNSQCSRGSLSSKKTLLL